MSDGGAIDFHGSSIDVVGSTFSGNSAKGSGGAIHVETGIAPLRLYGDTFADNVADSDLNGSGKGGAVASGGNTTMQNTILSGNKQSFFVGVYLQVDGDCDGAITSAFSVLKYKPSGCAITGTYLTGDAVLGPLQDNGGPTKTRAVLAGSPAIDAGNPGGCADPVGVPLLTDQRGAKRQLGARCDIGAYERTLCGDANGDGTVNAADVFYLINHLFAAGPPPPGLANVNGDASLSVSDVFYLINFLFGGGSAPSCPGT